MGELARVFLKIGALGFGGPAIIGLMQAEIQERRQWVSKARFMEGLALVNLLPGPVAAQLAIFLGYVRRGIAGGVIAGLAFIVPGFLIIVTLSAAYAAYGRAPWLRAASSGIAPVVLAIFAAAIYRMGRASMKQRVQVLIALAAAALAVVTDVAWLLLAAGCIGVALFHSWRRGLAALVVLGTFYVIAPGFGGVRLLEADSPSLPRLAAFFFQVGALTFGGGISILAFLQQSIVEEMGWLTSREFMDGLALGQMTPGPVLMLAAFVGYKLFGLAGAVVAAVAIFLPSFLVMLALLPLQQRMANLAWLKAAMQAITPAVIGVLAVALLQMAWHTLIDATGIVLLVVTFAAIVFRNVAPIPLMAAGALIGLMTWASAALAYRPFDSTDADVAGAGEFELELGPLGRLDEAGRKLIVTPAVVANFGLGRERELVIEGRGERAIDPQAGEERTALVDAGVFVKQVLREGVLQDTPGLSVATEYGLLLPSWHGANGTGFSVAGIVSQRSAIETLHLNAAVGVARNHQPSAFLGAILEGPYEWALRPVAEAFRSETRGDPRTDSLLVGAIWRQHKDLTFDFGLRAGRQGEESIREVRLGFTWTFSVKGT